MTALKAYITNLRSVGVAVSRALGEDISREQRDERIKLNLILAMNAVLIKLLVDKGLITDTDVQTAYGGFLADPTQYPDIPEPPPQL